MIRQHMVLGQHVVWDWLYPLMGWVWVLLSDIWGLGKGKLPFSEDVYTDLCWSCIFEDLLILVLIDFEMQLRDQHPACFTARS